MELLKYLNKYENRINLIRNLFEKDKIDISFDKLETCKKCDMEVLYFNDNQKTPNLFIFGFDFFIHENSEQEFKKVLGHNSLNFKIYNAYHKLKKSNVKVKISQILSSIQNEKKDSMKVHKILRRILVLAYYLNWELIKDKNDFDEDCEIKICENYLKKLKQRFDFNVILSVYEDADLFLFLNSRGRLNLVLKDIDKFTKKDIQEILPRVFEKVFRVKELNFK